MYVLGISAFYHDSAAALVRDGKVVSAAQEERFTRKKHDPGFPQQAIGFCLDQAGISLSDVEAVVFYDKPFLKFERLLETYVAFAPRGFASFRRAMPIWLREKLFLKDLLQKRLKAAFGDFDGQNKLLFSEHHLSHAASAFYPSPFDESVILTMDGVGEWSTTSAAIGRGSDILIDREIHFPHSLGLLYSAFTYYLGFKVNSGEYKVMGLAPYGEPVYVDTILDNLIDLKADGSFRLNLSYFNYCTGLTMTNGDFDALFGGPPRQAGAPLEKRDMDIAASIQAVTEEVVLRLARSLAAETGISNLCLAGGVALNCVANGKVRREGIFRDIWIQPAAGDAGGALGAALAGHHMYLKQPRTRAAAGDDMAGAYLGPEYAQDEIERRLAAQDARFQVLSDEKVITETAKALAEGAAVGWFQGRMEFGPRALGARSILSDPRPADAQRKLNLKVKYRESFRPFAPSVLEDRAGDWFEGGGASSYMLFVDWLREDLRKAPSETDHNVWGADQLNIARSPVPAVTHVDFSARLHTVAQDTNPRFHALLTEFDRVTGCPVLVNTSFNIRGEPIVCTPEDAFRCLMGTELELLVIGNCMVRKSEQVVAPITDYKDAFELD
ncbi:carbamoyltransferase [bacterium SCSIO 12827]|nr:carbamoyltransferase [bacterium SCSIO 12827]